MYFNLLFLVSIVKCKMYVIKTYSHEHQQKESFKPSPVEISMLEPRGEDYSNMELLDGARVSVGALSEKAHGVKGSVTFTSPLNLVISGFSYDGLAPDAFFMVVRPY